MKAGVGVFIWKISVALYLMAIGVMGIGKSGDLSTIFGIIKGNTDIFVVVAGVIALIAGVAIILEMLNIKVSFLDTLILIIAIIWAVFIVLRIVSWVGGGFSHFWPVLRDIAVQVMVLGSLLVASRRF